MQVTDFTREEENPPEPRPTASGFLRVWVGKSIKEGFTALLTPGDCESSPPANSYLPQLPQESRDQFEGATGVGEEIPPDPP